MQAVNLLRGTITITFGGSWSQFFEWIGEGASGDFWVICIYVFCGIVGKGKNILLVENEWSGVEWACSGSLLLLGLV